MDALLDPLPDAMDETPSTTLLTTVRDLAPAGREEISFGRFEATGSAIERTLDTLLELERMHRQVAGSHSISLRLGHFSFHTFAPERGFREREDGEGEALWGEVADLLEQGAGWKELPAGLLHPLPAADPLLKPSALRATATLASGAPAIVWQGERSREVAEASVGAGVSTVSVPLEAWLRMWLRDAEGVDALRERLAFVLAERPATALDALAGGLDYDGGWPAPVALEAAFTREHVRALLDHTDGAIRARAVVLAGRLREGPRGDRSR